MIAPTSAVRVECFFFFSWTCLFCFHFLSEVLCKRHFSVTYVFKSSGALLHLQAHHQPLNIREHRLWPVTKKKTQTIQNNQRFSWRSLRDDPKKTTQNSGCIPDELHLANSHCINAGKFLIFFWGVIFLLPLPSPLFARGSLGLGVSCQCGMVNLEM